MALPIWENENLLENYTRERTWFERLFTRPWHPFRSLCRLQRPSNKVYRMLVPQPVGQFEVAVPRARMVLMCHPLMAEHIRDSVKRDARNYIHIVSDASEGVIKFEYEA